MPLTDAETRQNTIYENWRPYSLMNLDEYILNKMLTNQV